MRTFSKTSSRFAGLNLYSLVVSLFLLTLLCIAFSVLLGLLEIPGSDLLLAFLSWACNILILVLILTVLALSFDIVEFILSMLIIGVLMMFLVPTYQSYLEKAKMTEAMSLMGGTKSQMVEYYSYHGHFPAKTEQLGIKTAGQYTTNIAVNNGTITATMRHNNLSLSLRPALPSNQKLPKVIAYVCGYATPPDGFMVQGDNKTNIPPHYLSSLTCR
jgi:type IV pilus assembly protein PilA